MHARASSPLFAADAGGLGAALAPLDGRTLLYEQGHLPDAQALLEEALATRRRELGPLAPETLGSLDKLGVVYRARGDSVLAVSFLEQALEGRRIALGSLHADTLRTMNHLGSALYDGGIHEPADTRRAQLNAALALYREALDGAQKTLGASHPLTLTSMNNLGNLHHARALLMPKFIAGRGANKEREKELQTGSALLRQALEASKAVRGTKHLETLISSSNLGSALRTLGKEQQDATLSEEARVLIKDAVEGIADAWAADLERRPRMQDDLRQGLTDALTSDEGGAPLLSERGQEAGVSERGGFDASGMFMLGLLSTAEKKGE